MKKFAAAALAALLSLSSLPAQAEGYQVNSFSARQEGMAHTGTALKLGAESAIFNPAAMVFSDKTVDISAGMSAIMAHATAVHGGKDYTTDNKTSTPFNFSSSFRVYDNLYAGVTLFVPYGSSINWGTNWPGAVLTQSVNLKVFTLQPTLSYKILPNLSVGAGLMMSWGNVNLDKGLVNASSMDVMMKAMGMPETAMYGDVTPASVNLTGSSRPVLGVNLGAYWEINPQWAVGVNFRSKQTLTVKKGLADVTYANAATEQALVKVLGLIDQANFKASMPLPNIFTAGVSYRPTDRWVIAFDAQFTGWKSYRWLDFEFDLPDALKQQFDQHIYKGYKNAMTYHLGAQFAATDRLDLRAGLMIDTTPCNRDNYNPETPGMTKIEPTVGLSFRPVKGLSIDLAFMYIKGMGMDNATGKYDDFIAKMAASQGINLPLKNPGEFKADYRLHAIAPAIGVSYAF